MSTRKKIRIFVSSPGDLVPERTIVARVINKVQREYSEDFEFIPIFWEDLPLSPTATFQEQINAVLNKCPIGIAIFILGNRLGSPPGKAYIKPNGQPYASGTEYEFDLMMEAYRRSGFPKILFYIKKTDRKTFFTDISKQDFSEKDSIDEILSQKRAVDNFIEEHFNDEQKGAYIAYHQIGVDGGGFESRLTKHLQAIISEMGLPSSLRLTYKGNPYKGLEAFQFEDESIFWGRSSLLNRVEQAIFDRVGNAMHSLPTVFVCGVSGAGKSSFVNAGLVPDLIRAVSGRGEDPVVLRVTPAELEPNLVVGLWKRIQKILTGLPLLEESGCYDNCAVNIKAMEALVRVFVRESEKCATLILVLDQLEELFTHASILAEERELFGQMILALVRAGNVLPIISMRSDFYSELIAIDAWRLIKETSVFLDIPQLTVNELRQVINEPALMAGYQWERGGAHDTPLNETILNDAVREKITLPILEFALTCLVDRCAPGKILSHKQYEEMGGALGALQNSANRMYRSLSSAERRVLHSILTKMINLDGAGERMFRRDVPVTEIKELPGGDSVLQTMLSARLVTISADDQDSPTVTISHESLLSDWDVIRNLSEHEKDFISIRNDCEASASKWLRSGKSKEHLLSLRVDLVRSEELLVCRPAFCSGFLKKYIRLSILRSSRKWLPMYVVGLILNFLGLLCIPVVVLNGEFREFAAAMLDEELYRNSTEWMKSLFWGLLTLIMLMYGGVCRFKGYSDLKRAECDIIINAILLLMAAFGCVIDEVYPLPALVIFISLYSCIKGIRNARYRHGVANGLFRRKDRKSAAFIIPVLIAMLLLLTQSGIGFLAAFHRAKYEEMCATFSTLSCRIVDGQVMSAYELVAKELRKIKDEKKTLSNLEAWVFCKVHLLLGQAHIVEDNKELVNGIEDPSTRRTRIQDMNLILGQEDRNFDLMKECPSELPGRTIYWGLIGNRYDDAREFFARLPMTLAFTNDEEKTHYAHALLLCRDDPKSHREAVRLYAEKKSDAATSRMIVELCRLKQNAEFRKKIESVESELHMKPIPGLFDTADSFAEKASWLVGEWTGDEGELKFQMNVDTDGSGIFSARRKHNGELTNQYAFWIRSKDAGNGVSTVEFYYPSFQQIQIGITCQTIDGFTCKTLYSPDAQQIGKTFTWKRTKTLDKK